MYILSPISNCAFLLNSWVNSLRQNWVFFFFFTYKIFSKPMPKLVNQLDKRTKVYLIGWYHFLSWKIIHEFNFIRSTFYIILFSLSLSFCEDTLLFYNQKINKNEMTMWQNEETATELMDKASLLRLCGEGVLVWSHLTYMTAQHVMIVRPCLTQRRESEPSA